MLGLLVATDRPGVKFGKQRRVNSCNDFLWTQWFERDIRACYCDFLLQF